jgi:hypothetical protein
MKQLQDNLVWLAVVLAMIVAVKLSTVDWKSAGQRVESERAVVERGVLLDQQLEEVKARHPEFFVHRDQR